MTRIVRRHAMRVLNATDIDAVSRHRLCCAAMIPNRQPSPVDCPDPLTRAPRVTVAGTAERARLHLAPLALQGAVTAVILRDTRGAALTDAQRLSHFPASPLVCLSWFQGLDAGFVERTAGGVRWRPCGAAVMLSGSQSRPTVGWAPTTGRAGMLCVPADVARTLFGVDVAAVHDRFVPAREVLDADWWPLLDALLDAPDDAATLAALECHMADRWRTLQGRALSFPSLRRFGRHWVERLAWQAHQWRRTHSPRQVERRIMAHSGRSLRQWQTLVKTEGVFFTARERYESGLPVDWAELAHDEGFADQAHLCRAVKRITGFSPNDFARRFAEDESFWLYRIWM
ncbi:AraC family transcriptional regulator [Azospirillum soli]|uniref:AraC family transcriptional regulator n=1 Tax=Azospirillum soli TaxID=1304799 RepID=UPI001AE8BBF5|nr:helix-turn-helix domain-containing protein [Azospirillum soli]MBP2312833.1 AraC-like DNA-binding protein [Azospirillum soli]